MVYHFLLGSVWMWIIKDQTGIYSPSLLFLSLFGSVFPDFEHLLFFFTYGKRDAYTKQIKAYIHDGDWRVLIRFIEKGHKYNTELRYHNVYTIMVLGIATAVLFTFQRYGGAVFAGAMITHYLFDMLDDLATLGKLNTNWYHWGGDDTKSSPSLWKHIDRTIER